MVWITVNLVTPMIKTFFNAALGGAGMKLAPVKMGENCLRNWCSDLVPLLPDAAFRTAAEEAYMTAKTHFALSPETALVSHYRVQLERAAAELRAHFEPPVSGSIVAEAHKTVTSMELGQRAHLRLFVAYFGREVFDRDLEGVMAAPLRCSNAQVQEVYGALENLLTESRKSRKELPFKQQIPPGLREHMEISEAALSVMMATVMPALASEELETAREIWRLLEEARPALQERLSLFKKIVGGLLGQTLPSDEELLNAAATTPSFSC